MNSLLDRLPWSEQKKIAAWQACRPLDGFSPAEYRIDAHSNLILWSHYGKQGDYGWEVDHIHPTALGGADELHNLRALHWQKNRQLGAQVGNALSALDRIRNINAFAADRPMTSPRGLFGSGRQ